MDKKYTDFMDEISSDELYEGLLAYGLFAEKLPPVFTSVPFFNYCKTRSEEFKLNMCWNEYITFRVMRTPLSKITSTGEIEQRFRLN